MGCLVDVLRWNNVTTRVNDAPVNREFYGNQKVRARLFSKRLPEASIMSRDTKKNRQVKCNTQEAVCARPVKPIIFSPSLMRSSFSFTR